MTQSPQQAEQPQPPHNDPWSRYDRHEEPQPEPGEKGGLHYIHARIDQLIHQTALEIGLIRLVTGQDPNDSSEQQANSLNLTRKRFWAAQDNAAEKHDQKRRQR